MATYQFLIELIPEIWAKENNYNPKTIYDQSGEYDPMPAWGEYILSKEMDDAISQLLPKSISWSENVLNWGDSKFNDIKVLLSENFTIESIIARIDLRQNCDPYLDKLLEFLKKFQLEIFIPEFRKIIKAEKIQLMNLIEISNAKKFLEDPKSFLKALEENPKKNQKD